jgi:hypothetical protein
VAIKIGKNAGKQTGEGGIYVKDGIVKITPTVYRSGKQHMVTGQPIGEENNNPNQARTQENDAFWCIFGGFRVKIRLPIPPIKDDPDFMP